MRTKFKLILVSFTFFSVLFYSCTDSEDNVRTELLTKAQSVIDSEPYQAQTYLNSINDPSQMDEEHYMQYILATVMIKRKLKEDITNYSLIFKAQQYFQRKGDLKNASLANLYLGLEYIKADEFTKAFNALKHSALYAEEIGNNDLAGRSYNNLGYVYYEQDVFDSAVVNYQRALKLYDAIPSSEDKKQRVLLNMGAAYDALKQYDKAIFYTKNSLLLAQSLNNKEYEYQSTKNLGVNYYGMGNYEKAVEYLQLALSMKDFANELSLVRTWLYLLNTYNKLHDNKTAKIYADLIETNINKINYPYTVKEMYAALSEYYRQIGNLAKSQSYANKELQEKELIQANNRSTELLKADKEFYLIQQKKNDENFKSSIYLYLIIVLAAIAALAIFGLAIYSKNRRNGQEVKKYVEQYNSLKKAILSNRVADSLKSRGNLEHLNNSLH